MVAEVIKLPCYYTIHSGDLFAPYIDGMKSKDRNARIW